MLNQTFNFFTLCGIMLISATPLTAADSYTVDNDHTSVNFKIQHAGISWVHGRFNEVRGAIHIDEQEMTNSSVQMTIQTDSIDTKIEKRDEHLKSADFFDVEKFPTIEFKSDSVTQTNAGLRVKGQISLHGETRPIQLDLVGGQTAEFPPGVHRIGYTANFKLKRSDFGMKTMLGPIGDEVQAEVSLEAVKQ